MSNDFKSALDKVRAEDGLKHGTAVYLRNEINKRRQKRPYRRFMPAAAAAFLFIAVFFFMPGAYVDMDVNPSVGLTLNRFNLVIGAQAYNDEGAEILSRTSIRFKTYDEAAQALLDSIISGGYLTDRSLVSVTVQMDGGKENEMLAGLNRAVAVCLNEHQKNASTDIYAVSDEIRLNAQEHHITPAKYLAITSLQEVDPTATFEGCMGHSISELQELAREQSGNYSGSHGSHHGGMMGNHN